MPRAGFLFSLPRLNFSSITGAACVLFPIAGLMGFGLLRGWAHRRFSPPQLVHIAMFFVLTFGINMAISTDHSTYRTLLPLAGGALALFVVGLGELTSTRPRPGSSHTTRVALRQIVFTLVCASAVLLARFNEQRWFVNPAAHEMQRMRKDVQNWDHKSDSEILFILPEGRPPDKVDNEFGIISTSEGWVPYGFIRMMVRERFESEGNLSNQMPKVFFGTEKDITSGSYTIDWRGFDPFTEDESK